MNFIFHAYLMALSSLNASENVVCYPDGVYNNYRMNKTVAIEAPETLPFEPPHDKTNKMTFAPSEDSDQPGHPPSLIGVFAVRMKKPWALSYTFSALRRL